MKILFPEGGATPKEIEELLRFAIEGRKRVKDQLMRIDTTYNKVCFTYQASDGKPQMVTTLEEEEYPGYYHKTITEGQEGEIVAAPEEETPLVSSAPLTPAPMLKEKHLTFQENQKGLSFDTLFGPYLKGATAVKYKALDEEVSVHLITTKDEFKGESQNESFDKMKESASSVGVNFSFEFDSTGTIHARHITTNHGWKISLNHGLDIFQHYEMNDAFTFANRLQIYRSCKAFEVMFVKHKREAEGR